VRTSLPNLTPEALTEYVSGAKYKEILAPNLPSVYRIATVDGYDGGVLPLQRYVDLRTMLVESGGTLSANPRQRDAVLRFLLAGVPDPDLLASLNVRYVVTDKLHDVWADNIYYDTAFSASVGYGERLALTPDRPFVTTSIGILSFLLGSHEGEQAAKVVVEGEDGQRHEFTLQVGIDTAQGDLNGPPPAQPRVGSKWRADPDAYNYLTSLQLPRPLTVRAIEVVGLLDKGTFQLRSLSLHDQRTGASTAVPVNGRFELLASGDLKLYRLKVDEPRLSLEQEYRVERDEGAALEALRGDGRLHLEKEPTWRSAPTALEREEGIDLVSSEPERVVLRVHTSRPVLVYQRETNFPGWKVWIDGREDEILQANGLFRAIPVTPGSHSVELRYEPPWVRVGIGVSLVSLVVVAFVLVKANRSRLPTKGSQ
jgi:hypothetical protein